MTDVPGPDIKESEQAEPSYAQAVAELERILDSLEEADIDVDTLSASVERAAWLLKLCRKRISKAEARIKEILADMEQDLRPDEAP